MKRLLLILSLLFGAASAQAIEVGSFRLDGGASFGYNPAQGNYIGLGLDFYTFVEDRLAVGVGGYYTFGSDATNDREYGVGPFVAYSYPLLEFLIPSIREDLVYVDEHTPIQIYQSPNWVNSYEANYGLASITTVALHIFFTRNFGVAGGYRFALGLNNSDLEKSHSGFFFGLTVAI